MDNTTFYNPLVSTESSSLSWRMSASFTTSFDETTSEDYWRSPTCTYNNRIYTENCWNSSDVGGASLYPRTTSKKAEDTLKDWV